MTAAEQARHAARQDAATHAARRQSEMDRIAAMTPEQREAEQRAFFERIAALG